MFSSSSPSLSSPPPRPVLIRQHASAAAAEPSDGEFVVLAPSPPTRDQLANLQALPAELARVMNQGPRSSNRGRTKSHRAQHLGRTAQRFYNEVASRPIPRNGISLTQGITLEMQSRTNYTTSTVATIYAGTTFTLAAFSGSTALIAVFDQYKFDQMEIWMEPLAAAGTTVFGEVASAIDLDDATAPTTFNQVIEKQGALCGNGASGRYHKWKPHMAVAAYSGAFTSYANEPAGWIDSSSSSVQHYGFKAAFTATPAAINYMVTIRAVVSFRAPCNN